MCPSAALSDRCDTLVDFLTIANVDRLGAVGTLILMCILIITDKFVWHTRYKAEQERADRWERIALEALTAGAQAGVHAAEVAVGVVSAIPDPQGERDKRAAEELNRP